jgi:hypothetical protein
MVTIMKDLFVCFTPLTEFSIDKKWFDHEYPIDNKSIYNSKDLYRPAFCLGVSKEGNLEYFRIEGYLSKFKQFAQSLKHHPFREHYNLPQYNLENVTLTEIIDYMIENWDALDRSEGYWFISSNL